MSPRVQGANPPSTSAGSCPQARRACNPDSFIRTVRLNPPRSLHPRNVQRAPPTHRERRVETRRLLPSPKGRRPTGDRLTGSFCKRPWNRTGRSGRLKATCSVRPGALIGTEQQISRLFSLYLFQVLSQTSWNREESTLLHGQGCCFSAAGGAQAAPGEILPKEAAPGERTT